MEHKKQTHLRLVADVETSADLASVAAAIRPLPEEVAPSQEFLARTRLQLLELKPAEEKDSPRRAA